MNKQIRLGIANAFRLAKQHLSKGCDDKCIYICYALDRIKSPYKYDAKQIIVTRLNGHGTVSMWLADQGIEPWQHGLVEVQAYRHRWLDALIKEFSK